MLSHFWQETILITTKFGTYILIPMLGLPMWKTQKMFGPLCALLAAWVVMGIIAIGGPTDPNADYTSECGSRMGCTRLLQSATLAGNPAARQQAMDAPKEIADYFNSDLYHDLLITFLVGLVIGVPLVVLAYLREKKTMGRYITWASDAVAYICAGCALYEFVFKVVIPGLHA